MKKIYPLLILCLISGLAKLSATSNQSGQNRPNIIVIFTDDQGYADLGIQGVDGEVKTPNIDRLALQGARMISGYVSAPICSPSRAGLMTGRHQQRFGLDHNGSKPLPLDEVLLPQRLKEAGYRTGMVGKWHLDPFYQHKAWVAENMPGEDSVGINDIPFEKRLPYFPSERGFDDCWHGSLNRYLVNFDLDGNDIEKQWITDKRFRVDVQTEAALAFIRRSHDNPFFLYLSYYAPHVPLEAPEKYLDRFPDDLPEARRYCLAMISAMDDGVGRMLEALDNFGVRKNTLIFFISDNGAMLIMHRKDPPGSWRGITWNGALNDPLVGEKGMLAEGGIRVPFIVCWPDVIPGGQTYEAPVISLDVAATAVAAAGLDQPEELDGVNLLPFLTGEISGEPHDALFWRFSNQAAIRKGNWKYLIAGGHEFLFDLESAEGENENLILKYPEKATQLKDPLEEWTQELEPPGMPGEKFITVEQLYYKFYFDVD
jgi:arylsulfatase A-like enzyme